MLHCIDFKESRARVLRVGANGVQRLLKMFRPASTDGALLAARGQLAAVQHSQFVGMCSFCELCLVRLSDR